MLEELNSSRLIVGIKINDGIKGKQYIPLYKYPKTLILYLQKPSGNESDGPGGNYRVFNYTFIPQVT